MFSEGKLSGGYFTVDMKSIYITDIPLSDPIPRKNITRHLNSDFETSIFPNASFIIKEISALNSTHWSLSGNMTIKGITKPIQVVLNELEKGKAFGSSFSINRSEWKIGENGSWLEKKLVDEEIVLNVNIVVL